MASVVIVNWNSGQMLKRCVHSLFEHAADCEIVVVDNASEDESLGPVEGSGPQIRVIRNSANKGFAAANNTGWRACRSEKVLFLNPDTECGKGAVEALERTLDGAAEVAAVGGALVDQHGEIQKGFTVRAFPSVGSVAADMLLLDELLPGNRWTRRYRMVDFDHLSAREVDQPAGACLMVRRETLEETGGFDEVFFPAWFEDVDLCRRIRDNGGVILFQPAARFVHHGGSSLKKLPREEFLRFYCCNMVRYFAKHHGRNTAEKVRKLALAGMRLRAALALVRPPSSGRTRSDNARLYWTVARQIAAAHEAPA